MVRLRTRRSSLVKMLRCASRRPARDHERGGRSRTLERPSAISVQHLPLARRSARRGQPAWRAAPSSCAHDLRVQRGAAGRDPARASTKSLDVGHPVLQQVADAARRRRPAGRRRSGSRCTARTAGWRALGRPRRIAIAARRPSSVKVGRHPDVHHRDVGQCSFHPPSQGLSVADRGGDLEAPVGQQLAPGRSRRTAESSAMTIRIGCRHLRRERAVRRSPPSGRPRGLAMFRAAVDGMDPFGQSGQAADGTEAARHPRRRR